MNLLRVGLLSLSLYVTRAWSQSPQEALSYVSAALSEAQFTTLKHPAFPKHGVRIKKTKFCDGTVDSYTGYIDVGARHLFFYFFESRSDPDKDDVILWTNGGPGGSSALGLFMEQGESLPGRRMPTRRNTTPNLGTPKPTCFSFDQPVGVGWSYADFGEHVGTTEEGAKDIAAFVAVFFEHFHKFKGRAFHLSGESYGGRYIPVYAAAVYDQNKELLKKGLTPINLNSVMIGNGYTDFYTMMLSYYDMVCTPATVPPVLDIQTCIRMKQVLPRCEKWVKQACIDIFDEFSCQAATSFCSEELEEPLILSGLNPYDITVECEGEIEDTICYPITKAIVQYLSRHDIRKLIGAEHDMKSNFSATYHYISNLLDRGVRVLIYVGVNDFGCNHVGNEKWTSALEWSGQDGYRAQLLREWSVNGKKAGKVRSYGGLSFVTVDGAGHMVPYDKPAESLELVNRWMAGEDI
ncbi:serine carboxypeptidase [Coprinellus micaceus]|uniref:Carboxypeptidase n=1 Tax=Coprinellus micaceus TaxID=71717 RepID=A0A4Y7SEW1_COPMI|nr:serine carboxypeptidase [Coprinellus micaceus]